MRRVCKSLMRWKPNGAPVGPFLYLTLQILFGSVCLRLLKVPILVFSSLLYAHGVHTHTRARTHRWGLRKWGGKWKTVLTCDVHFHREPDSVAESWVSPPCPPTPWTPIVALLTLAEGCSLFDGVPLRAGMGLASPPPRLLFWAQCACGGSSVRFDSIKEWVSEKSAKTAE